MNISGFLAVPQELRDAARWVLWSLEERNGKPTKVPYAVNGHPASTVNPKTWCSFDTALDAYERAWGEFEGLGCVIAAPYIGIDLDKCRDPETGVVEIWAQEALRELNSYTELSPSGRGFHIWVKGVMPPGGSRTGKVEIYSRARYFTMTGQHYPGTPLAIETRDLIEFHKKHITHSAAATETKDSSQSAKEFRIACDLWKKYGPTAKEEDISLEFFRQATPRAKWEQHRDYVSRTIKAAKGSVFNLPEQAESQLNKVRFSEIEDKSMNWLWPDRIPKGKLVMFYGNPDVGKTSIACDLIAHYTTGTEYPDGSQAVDTGEVLFLGSEDDPADTLKPRLIAAGANIDRVHYVKGVRLTKGAKRVERALALDSDLSLIEADLSGNPKIGLVVIDPITSYLGKADINKEQSLRDTLNPIKELAEKTGVTFICLGHFSKRTDVGVLHKVGGAVAMTGVARAVWLFMKNPEVDGQYLMLLGKGNLTKKRSGLKYSIIEREIRPGLGMPVIEWHGLESRDAESISATLSDPKERASAKARLILEGIKEPIMSDKVREIAKEKGVSWSTVWRSVKEFGIRSEKRGNDWWWIPRA